MRPGVNQQASARVIVRRPSPPARDETSWRGAIVQWTRAASAAAPSKSPTPASGGATKRLSLRATPATNENVPPVLTSVRAPSIAPSISMSSETQRGGSVAPTQPETTRAHSGHLKSASSRRRGGGARWAAVVFCRGGS
jgi:hypothetical protein